MVVFSSTCSLHKTAMECMNPGDMFPKLCVLHVCADMQKLEFWEIRHQRVFSLRQRKLFVLPMSLYSRGQDLRD